MTADQLARLSGPEGKCDHPGWNTLGYGQNDRVQIVHLVLARGSCHLATQGRTRVRKRTGMTKWLAELRGVVELCVGSVLPQTASAVPPPHLIVNITR